MWPTIIYVMTLAMSAVILYFQYWVLFLSNASGNVVVVAHVSGALALLTMFIGVVNITGDMEHSCCCDVEQQRTRVLTENP